MPELQSVVDEEDDEEPVHEEKAQGGFDWDRVCAYKTFKIVKIKDRWMGFLYWGVVLTHIMYTMIVLFIMRGAHMDKEQGIGTIITRFHGKAFDGQIPFDEADLRFPVIEPGGAFIMTRSVVMPGQTVGQCIDWDEPKKCPCHNGEICEGDYCAVPGWCPSMGDTNVDDPPDGFVEHKVTGLEYCILEMLSGITFPSLATENFFVTGNSGMLGYKNEFRNITVEKLLTKVETAPGSPPLTLADIQDTGALIGVSFFWNCDVVAQCEPLPVIKRLDTGQGFVQKRVRHGRKNGKVTRDAIYMFGLRVLVDSSGIGKRFSLMQTVIQIGSCLALLRTAAMIADFVMLNLYSESYKDAYYKCKVKETEDYSDLQDRINLIKDMQKRETEDADKLAPGTRERRKGGAGAHVALGLGPGGRGGDAATIMRGRAI